MEHWEGSGGGALGGIRGWSIWRDQKASVGWKSELVFNYTVQ